jgi:hypothetical protein
MTGLQIRRLALCLVVLVASGFLGRSSVSPHGEAMARAAAEFLATLSPQQRNRAMFPFASDERTRWHFVPGEMFPRRGVVLKELDAGQRLRAQALLRTGLSQQGYLTATAIMELEQVLRALEPQGQFARDPEAYFLSVFGTPDAAGTWGWRVEGHHLSLHFTVVAGRLTVSTPSFFGTNPAEVRQGPEKGRRVLASVEDPARALLLALAPDQRAQALLGGAVPGDIVTGVRFPVEALSPAGVSASTLSPAQQGLLRQLIEAYTSLMAGDIAAARWARIEGAGFEKVSFAWAGAATPGQPHYYRVQGPTFLIEYDNTQNDANHIHAVWREFNGDFGQDLLREHVHDGQH